MQQTGKVLALVGLGILVVGGLGCSLLGYQSAVDRAVANTGLMLVLMVSVPLIVAGLVIRAVGGRGRGGARRAT